MSTTGSICHRSISDSSNNFQPNPSLPKRKTVTNSYKAVYPSLHRKSLHGKEKMSLPKQKRRIPKRLPKTHTNRVSYHIKVPFNVHNRNKHPKYTDHNATPTCFGSSYPTPSSTEGKGVIIKLLLYRFDSVGEEDSRVYDAEAELKAVTDELADVARGCGGVSARLCKASSTGAFCARREGDFVTLDNQPGTRDLGALGFCRVTGSSARGSVCVVSGRDRADPMSFSVSERARTCIEGATAGMWLCLDLALFVSARRSSTMVLSSRTSFSTSESPALPCG